MRTTIRRCLWLFLLWYICNEFGTTAYAESRIENVTTPLKIREILQNRRDSVSAWYLEYDAAEPAAGIGAKIHRRMAARFPDEFMHLGAHEMPNQLWQADPELQSLIIVGRESTILRAFNREYSQSPQPIAASLPGTASSESMLAVLPWWINYNIVPPEWGSRVPLIYTAIADRPEYALSVRNELVGNVLCNVSEFPDHDRLWLDLARNGMLVAREFYSPVTKHLLQRVEVVSAMCLPGKIWVPKAVHISQYEDVVDRDGRSSVRRIVDSTLEVSEFRVNADVPSDLFAVRKGPGWIRFNANGISEQVEPGGTDFIDVTLSRIRSGALRSSPTTSRWPQSAEAFVEFVVDVACIGIIASSWYAMSKSGGRGTVLQATAHWQSLPRRIKSDLDVH